METAIQRVPLMHIRAQMSRAESTGEGVEWYRRILTETGDKPIAHHLHQKLSRQLAEVLLRGVPDSSYSSPATNSQAVAKKAQSLRYEPFLQLSQQFDHCYNILPFYALFLL